jgi:hypothetical protein
MGLGAGIVQFTELGAFRNPGMPLKRNIFFLFGFYPNFRSKKKDEKDRDYRLWISGASIG